jgi:hypothetical protein
VTLGGHDRCMGLRVWHGVVMNRLNGEL